MNTNDRNGRMPHISSPLVDSNISRIFPNDPTFWIRRRIETVAQRSVGVPSGPLSCVWVFGTCSLCFLLCSGVSKASLLLILTWKERISHFVCLRMNGTNTEYVTPWTLLTVLRRQSRACLTPPTPGGENTSKPAETCAPNSKNKGFYVEFKMSDHLEISPRC